MKILFSLIKSVVNLILLIIEGFFWIIALAWGFLIKGLDFCKAQSNKSGETIYCPQGHAITTSGGTYECEQCGYVYQGSIWQCANPECQAITPYINCPDCGLSVRNPYRWGRQ